VGNTSQRKEKGREGQGIKGDRVVNITAEKREEKRERKDNRF